jgi:hypothetical protein
VELCFGECAFLWLDDYGGFSAGCLIPNCEVLDYLNRF